MLLKRVAQFGELVVALHGNAPGKIALRDARGAFIEAWTARVTVRVSDTPITQEMSCTSEQRDQQQNENQRDRLGEIESVAEDCPEHRRRPAY